MNIIRGARSSATASGFRRDFVSFSLSLMLLSFVVALAPSAWGQSGQQVEVEFDVPAQSLDVALEAYMQVTGLQVLYQSALTTGRLSTE